jgi:hypothetical protein
VVSSRVYTLAADGANYVQRLPAVRLIWSKVRGSALTVREVQSIAGKSDV